MDAIKTGIGKVADYFSTSRTVAITMLAIVATLLIMLIASLVIIGVKNKQLKTLKTGDRERTKEEELEDEEEKSKEEVDEEDELDITKKDNKKKEIEDDEDEEDELDEAELDDDEEEQSKETKPKYKTNIKTTKGVSTSTMSTNSTSNTVYYPQGKATTTSEASTKTEELPKEEQKKNDDNEQFKNEMLDKFKETDKKFDDLKQLIIKSNELKNNDHEKPNDNNEIMNSIRTLTDQYNNLKDMIGNIQSGKHIGTDDIMKTVNDTIKMVLENTNKVPQNNNNEIQDVKNQLNELRTMMTDLKYNKQSADGANKNNDNEYLKDKINDLKNQINTSNLEQKLKEELDKVKQESNKKDASQSTTNTTNDNLLSEKLNDIQKQLNDIKNNSNKQPQSDQNSNLLSDQFAQINNKLNELTNNNKYNDKATQTQNTDFLNEKLNDIQNQLNALANTQNKQSQDEQNIDSITKQITKIRYQLDEINESNDTGKEYNMLNKQLINLNDAINKLKTRIDDKVISKTSLNEEDDYNQRKMNYHEKETAKSILMALLGKLPGLSRDVFAVMINKIQTFNDVDKVKSAMLDAISPNEEQQKDLEIIGNSTDDSGFLKELILALLNRNICDVTPENKERIIEILQRPRIKNNYNDGEEILEIIGDIPEKKAKKYVRVLSKSNNARSKPRVDNLAKVLQGSKIPIKGKGSGKKILLRKKNNIYMRPPNAYQKNKNNKNLYNEEEDIEYITEMIKTVNKKNAKEHWNKKNKIGQSEALSIVGENNVNSPIYNYDNNNNNSNQTKFAGMQYFNLYPRDKEKAWRMNQFFGNNNESFFNYLESYKNILKNYHANEPIFIVDQEKNNPFISNTYISANALRYYIPPSPDFFEEDNEYYEKYLNQDTSILLQHLYNVSMAYQNAILMRTIQPNFYHGDDIIAMQYEILKLNSVLMNINLDNELKEYKDYYEEYKGKPDSDKEEYLDDIRAKFEQLCNDKNLLKTRQRIQPNYNYTDLQNAKFNEDKQIIKQKDHLLQKIKSYGDTWDGYLSSFECKKHISEIYGIINSEKNVEQKVEDILSVAMRNTSKKKMKTVSDYYNSSSVMNAYNKGNARINNNVNQEFTSLVQKVLSDLSID